MDHYLATIQTILDRCENDNASPSINDMEIIKINLCRIIQTRYGITQLWFIPLIERIQNACCRHYNDVDMLWEGNYIPKYNIGSKEVELEVVESSDASCEGCVFNNSKNYYCKDTHCIDVDRKDDIDVIYKEVKRS